MELPVKRAAGWSVASLGGTAVPRTGERKRRGRNVDIIGGQPTPPRSRATNHLPTPETVRRSAKPTKSSAQPDITLLPTPQTLPRHKRRIIHDAEDAVEDPASPPSPSGHTTFYLSSSTAPRAQGVAGRRPGLTFAQQMGLLNQTAAPGTSTGGFGGRLGAGVGMGGARTTGHGKVDQISRERSEAGCSLVEENPFIVNGPVGLASPGALTFHRPGMDMEDDSDEPTSSPLQLRTSHPPRSAKPTVRFSASALLSPPPTEKAPRIRAVPSAAAQQQKRAKEEMKRMMDAESNPFLVRPGEEVIPRPGSVVDESKPTVTYVFRGAKKVFANPWLGGQRPFPAAELDPEDEDYEPHPCPPPRLLWPSAGNTSKHAGSPFGHDRSSPPSSPMVTPKATRLFSRHDEGMEDVSGPRDAFSDEEGIQSASAEEEELPVRRGLLFASTGGTKRASRGALEGTGKKPRKGRL